ncbi:hypothetical protein CCACVL1_08933, partial [Corchorus capsularis]
MAPWLNIGALVESGLKTHVYKP